MLRNKPKLKAKKAIFLICTLLSCYSITMAQQVFIEAESLGEKHSWVIDQQGFEKMGSAYLMANGMGHPIKDIEKMIPIKKPGKYHAYVRTYNWISPWYEGKGPGKIQLLVNGKALPTILGETGNQWEWQYAGKAKLTKNSKIGLHDLTGFNGRVDAIYFSKNKKAPVNDIKKLTVLRHKLLGFNKPVVASKSDLVVVGGGMAGSCAALSAARLGLKVTLIQNRPVLGGNNSPEIQIRILGSIDDNLYPNLGNLVRELTGIPFAGEGKGSEKLRLIKKGHENEISDLRLQIMKDEPNISLFLNTHAYGVKMEGDNISAIIARSTQTGEEYVFPGRYFVDATGDGTIGFEAGADFHIGRENRAFANEPTAPIEEDQKKMGMSVRWKSQKMKDSGTFPKVEELPWAMQCSDEYHHTDFTGRWFWETGLEINNATEAELVRDNALRAIFGNWAYVKNNLDEFKDRKIVWLSHVGGKRESRRLLGDIIVNENDIMNQVKYPDQSYTTTWSIDLHYANKENAKHFPGWEWITYCQQPKIKPYHVPYRTLYSRNVNNLFMAGRDVSVTHIALGTVRVMATTGMMGEVVGMAAAICVQKEATPREVYAKYFDELKNQMQKGAPTKANELQKISPNPADAKPLPLY